MNQSKLTDLTIENILFTGESVKMQITDSISENMTNSDIESISRFYIFMFEIEKKLSQKFEKWQRIRKNGFSWEMQKKEESTRRKIFVNFTGNLVFTFTT